MLRRILSIKIFKHLDYKVVIILAAAIFFRFFLLDIKPPHHDEGTIGSFVKHIEVNGFYKYNPTYHGPLTYYMGFISQTLFGHNLYALRTPIVLIGILTIYWLLLFRQFFGQTTCLIVALCMLLSPAYGYFSRGTVMDLYLSFFDVLIFWGVMGLWHYGTKKYIWAISLGLTGMILTKETFVINLSCFILAIFFLFLYEKAVPSRENPPAKQSWTWKDLSLAIGCSLGLIIFFYSGTFFNWSGILELCKTFHYCVATSTQGRHAKPFFFWITLMSRYEWTALLGLASSILCIIFSSRWLKFVSIYGLCLFLAYSLIPYKTPWLIVNFLWPFYFAFGNLINYLMKTSWGGLATLVCVGLFLNSGITSYKLSFINHSSDKEPYVYVQTYNDIKKFTDPLFKLDISRYSLAGIIMLPDSWPLPWILSDFSQVGYFGSRIPNNYNADFLLVESKRINEVEEKLEREYFTETFRLKSTQGPSKLYLSYDRFKDIFPGREPEFIPKPKEPIPPGQGLLALFYPNKELTGEPQIKKQVGTIDFYWGVANIVEDKPIQAPFGIQFIGEINIPQAGTTLILATDDGGYVEIDGNRIIDDPGPHPTVSKSAVVTGISGWRKIRIGYYDIGGGATVKLLWKDASGVEHLVPANQLRFNERSLNQ
ncbi:MAG: TIGR03663 family protein [Candidatus Melainabacteria bacterium]|nr:TIGR03663 family protein [Candidatus Melainabacteria bacterium]